jgi:hypothetical protein
VRHTRKDPDVFPSGLDVKRRRGAALVVQRGLPHEHVRLPLVDLGHLPAALGEPLFDPVDDRLVDFDRQSERLRQRLPRQVILGRPEAAGDDQRPGSGDGVADLVNEISERIADHGLAHQRHAIPLQRRDDLQ